MFEVNRLKELLLRVRELLPAEEFCGVGVVIYSNLSGLPISPLCADSKLPDEAALAESIAACSRAGDACHDGFHFVDSSWTLTHRNQYFAPYASQPNYKSSRPVGARFLAAQHGSELEQVICTGLISQREGVLVFVDGVPA